MKILEKVKIQNLCNRSLIGKHSDHSKKLKNSLKNESFYKSFINNVLYCASKYLKRTFGENLHEIWCIKYIDSKKYLLTLYFAMS